MKVPFAARGNLYEQDDIDALVTLLSQDENYNKWDVVREFEQAWIEAYGSNHALAVSSCTAALHLAIKALELAPGDEVILTPWTWVATGNILLLEGLVPKFVDIDPATLNLDLDKLEQSVSDKTKAVIAVHFAGNPLNMDRLKSICQQGSIKLIQDAAHAAGAKYQDRSIEAWGDIVCYSFYTQKNLSTLGEGGMVTCLDEQIFERLKLYQNHGVRYLNNYQNPETMKRPWLRECVVPGFNYRMSEGSCAVGLTQLAKLDRMNAARQEMANAYLSNLSDIKGIELPDVTEHAKSSWHFFVIQVTSEFSMDRDQLLAALKERGVQTNVHYTPLYHFEPFVQFISNDKSQFEHAERCYDQVLSLPLYPTMTTDMVTYVSDCIKELAHD